LPDVVGDFAELARRRALFLEAAESRFDIFGRREFTALGLSLTSSTAARCAIGTSSGGSSPPLIESIASAISS